MAGLAVSNAFTVESYHKGTKHSYTISMQKGVPVTMHMGDSPTAEPDGLELTVAVESGDIHNYKMKAEYLYKYFDHKPTVNRDDVVLHLKTEEHISDDWFIQVPESSYERTNYVVMSQVPYAIPDNHIVENQGFKNLVIKAPPGSVSFNPGRESLSLNKDTVEFLNKTFEKVAEDYVSAAIVAMANSTNDADLMATYANLVTTAPGSAGQKLNPTKFISSLYQNMFCARRYASGIPSFHNVAETAAFNADTNDTISIAHKSTYYKTSKVMAEDNCLNWKEFFGTQHVIVDLKTKFRKELNDQFAGRSLITWQRKGKADIEETVKHAKRYLDGMNIPYKLASELVDVTVSTGSTPREGLYVSSVHGTNIYKSQKMEESDITSGTYLYLKLKNSTPDIPEDSEFSFEEYCLAYKLLAKKDKDTPPIRGVAKKYQSYVEELDNWVDFQDYIKENMEASTFKTDMKDPPNSLVYGLINRDCVDKYPTNIQNYFEEMSNYHKYKSSAGYIAGDTERGTIEKFGSSTETYQWDITKSADNLRTTYPKTFDILTGGSYFYCNDVELVSHLAKLEEFYATHTVE